MKFLEMVGKLLAMGIITACLFAIAYVIIAMAAFMTLIGGLWILTLY